MALFTTAQAKEYLGIPSGNTTHDTLIGNLATRIGTLFDTYTRRTIEAAAHTEEIDGTGQDRIIVTNPPINSVTSLKITLDRDFAGTSAEDSGDFVFDDAGVITLVPTQKIGSVLLSDQNPTFPRGIRNIQVIYNGGFSTVPEDIVQAALLMCGYLFNRRRTAGLSSMTMGGATLTFQGKALPDEVALMLNPYRRYPVLWGSSVS